MNLTHDQKSLHDHAVDLCRQHRALEWQIIEVLQKIERQKLYLKLEVTSLFQYATKLLNLSESTAYAFIAVARKSSVTPQLKIALQQQRLSVSKAARIVSALTKENASDLVDFAERNTIRNIDFEIARRKPKALARESAKPVSADHVELKISLSHETFIKLQRAQAVLAQKQAQNPTLAAVLDEALDEYLKRQDPVVKAKRAVKIPRLCKTESQFPKPRPKALRRTRLTAAQKHQVFTRDEGRCTYRDKNGNRCENDRWLQVHHIRPVSRGGGFT